MCRPFNDHEPFTEEFRGLIMYIFAVISFYFLVYNYKAPQKPKPPKRSPVSSSVPNLGTPSDSNVDYLKSHEFRQEQRAKYARSKTIKRRQTGKGSQGSLLSRQFGFEGFNISPFNSPKLERNNAFDTSLCNSVSSVAGSEDNFREQCAPVRKHKTNFDRKSSLRRKAFSAEMLKYSSEEGNYTKINVSAVNKNNTNYSHSNYDCNELKKSLTIE